jgi:hypothetical protein
MSNMYTQIFYSKPIGEVTARDFLVHTSMINSPKFIKQEGDTLVFDATSVNRIREGYERDKKRLEKLKDAAETGEGLDEEIEEHYRAALDRYVEETLNEATRIANMKSVLEAVRTWEPEMPSGQAHKTNMLRELEGAIADTGSVPTKPRRLSVEEFIDRNMLSCRQSVKYYEKYYGSILDKQEEKAIEWLEDFNRATKDF